jgi:hypothetical protein
MPVVPHAVRHLADGDLTWLEMKDMTMPTNTSATRPIRDVNASDSLWRWAIAVIAILLAIGLFAWRWNSDNWRGANPDQSGANAPAPTSSAPAQPAAGDAKQGWGIGRLGAALPRAKGDRPFTECAVDWSAFNLALIVERASEERD